MHSRILISAIDQTRLIARQEGAIVINGGGKGLGYAMYKGLKSTLEYEPDYIVSYDADGQCDPAEIMNFLTPLVNDEAELILGSRFKEDALIGYKYRFKNRFGVVVLVKILRALTGKPLTDSHGGIRALKPEVAFELEMLGTHTYVQETIIDAAEKGFRIKEIPSVWRKRGHGGSRVVSSIPTYVFHTLPILILRSKQHIKWLYTLGIILVLLAFGFFGSIAYESSFQLKQMGNRLPGFLLVALLILTGIQLFFFGFLIDLIKEIKYRIDRLDR